MTEKQVQVVTNLALPLTMVFSMLVMVVTITLSYADGLRRDDLIAKDLEYMSKAVARLDSRIAQFEEFKLRNGNP